MEKHFAIIKNGLVQGIIVAEINFINSLAPQYDFIIDVSEGQRPTTGDSYYPDTKTFVSNHLVEHTIPVDLSLPHLHMGTQDGFEPFLTSKYSVSYESGTITIGCKKYPAIAILDTLHKLLVEKQKTTTYFTALKDGPTHGKFGITWEDAQKIYDALKKVKF
jgi:hypothetical protein